MYSSHRRWKKRFILFPHSSFFRVFPNTVGVWEWVFHWILCVSKRSRVVEVFPRVFHVHTHSLAQGRNSGAMTTKDGKSQQQQQGEFDGENHWASSEIVFFFSLHIFSFSRLEKFFFLLRCAWELQFACCWSPELPSSSSCAPSWANKSRKTIWNKQRNSVEDK